MILNLDKNFNPFPNKEAILYENFTFSGGEPHIKIKSDLTKLDKVIVSHRINSFNDLGLLLVTIDAIKRMNVDNIEVFIPYFPGARQDRVMIPGEPLTVKVYANILNNSGVNNVTIYDPHSEVTPALLDNCTTIDNHSFIEHVVKELPNDLLLISPDGGALKKIYKVAAHLKNYEVIECGKTRDVATGKLSGFKVSVDDLKNKPCLIVDDICDGGGTFLGLADELKRKNAGDLFLAVSHGIFSKGTEHLLEKFERIFTTDSVKKMDSKEIVQISIAELNK